MLTRRDALKLGSAAGAAVLFPVNRLASALSDDPPGVPPFSLPLPVPPVLKPAHRTADTDFYDMRISETELEILPGFRTRTLTFAGSFPGPTVRARRGREVVIRQFNGLRSPVTVHLHGAAVPASSDGHPMDPIAPGRARVYRYPNDQRAATLWYHDHTHELEAEQIYRGLSGAYLLSDPVETRLPLPTGEFDVPLLLRDAKFDSEGQFAFVPDDFTNRPTVLVNGRPQPHFEVKRKLYRLRLINGSNLEMFRFRLTSGAPFLQIAADGGFLRAPAVRPEIDLWPAERAEVLVDFRSVPPGTAVVLQNAVALSADKRDILQFRVGGGAPPSERESDVPSWSRTAFSPPRTEIPGWPATEPPRRQPTRTRRFVLGLDLASGRFLINGRGFDPDRVDATIEHGSTEIWEIVNGDAALGIQHSMHLHLVQFRVLDRNGKPEPAHDSFPKDTVRLYPGDVVRIQVTFDSHLGRFPFHCHFLDHAAHSMMGQFEVVPRR
ncbi:multicopper oxidase family protein [Amycolatopsis sp. Hca4]|uniref:multicopper oxidase family protein n=1 Tax=Amycolatopsis sp. Hca4 TaxID=2742131 RepID=UPI001591104E|nr:multicopper oxidase domain-containing protein [Amycolatopsis sp. Hca4]QKV74048.1 multicopper oxidase domain-containing protein [Amycolatopsis sp. Hca4]